VDLTGQSVQPCGWSGPHGPVCAAVRLEWILRDSLCSLVDGVVLMGQSVQP
jgi:hypothetical protein